MNTEIYIISGFLGAGKTTLIQKLLKEAFIKDKVVLIENDFGEISVDAAILKSSGIQVKEINSGCICCSLSGDFVKALKELLKRFQPDKIIIEPSGVGKLSDIMKACLDPSIEPLAKVKLRLTVADVKRCKMYLDNFGEFFEDQIQNADTILLSRTENFPDKVKDAYELVKSLNDHALILSKPWDQITSDEILYPDMMHSTYGKHKVLSHEHRYHHELHEHKEDCHCGHHGSHDHEEGCHCRHHDHENKCGHNHSAKDIFDTITIQTTRTFNMEDLKTVILNMEQKAHGTILRVKGIVQGTNGYINLQYLPGDIQITRSAVHGDMICIIGRNLNQQELIGLFNGK